MPGQEQRFPEGKSSDKTEEYSMSDKITLEEYGKLVEDAWAEWQNIENEEQARRDEIVQAARTKCWEIDRTAKAEFDKVQKAAEKKRLDDKRFSWWNRKVVQSADDAYYKVVYAAQDESDKVTRPAWAEKNKVVTAAEARYQAVTRAATAKRDKALRAAEARLEEQ
jgi:hypothetical protein